MPTYPAEFAIGQPVLLDIEGTTYRSTITRAYWDAALEYWLYQVAGLTGCEFPADDIFTA